MKLTNFNLLVWFSEKFKNKPQSQQTWSNNRLKFTQFVTPSTVQSSKFMGKIK